MSDLPTARASRRASEVSLAPGDRVGEWTIARAIATGGMAAVYEASGVGRRVAIKLAHATFAGDPLVTESFAREARIAARVGHTGVATALAAGTHAGRPYLVLELLDGASLGERISSGPPLPRAIACDLLVELVGVLRAAHAAGITHRDLKPDNIVLADGRLWLVDWGVAHVAGETDPFAAMIAGTLTYVAPEQIRGEPIGSAADIYSLGVLAFRLLCTRAPFAAPTDLQLIKLHLHAPPPRARTAWPAIPDALDDLIARMLAKDPTDRPGLDEIEVVLQGVRQAQLALGTQPHAKVPAVSRWTPLALGLARVCALFGMRT